MNPRLKRNLVACLTSLMGVSMVVGLLVVMNAFGKPPEPDTAVKQVVFQAAPKLKKKKKKKSVRKRRSKPKSISKSSAPPPPNLASNMAGIGFDLPGIEQGSVTDVSGQLIGKVSSTVMTEDSVDNKPKPRRRTAVSYPARARSEGITGYVVLNLLVNESGQVERVRVLESKPAGVFDAAAKETVTDWQFDPATYEGEAVRVWARQTIRFDLT